jgi:hypothetical protein
MTRSVMLLTLLLATLLSKSIGYPRKIPARPFIESRLNDPELQLAWMKFARVVQTYDLPALYQLSTGCIHCIDCVANT